MTMLGQITGPYFVAGMEVTDGVVTRTAPIIFYMRGWAVRRVITYGRQKRWQVNFLSIRVDQ